MNNTLEMFSMDSIERKEIDWLWYPYIPYGKLTIIQGDPGEGKTTFALHLASLLSQGMVFGDEAVKEKPINILYQTAEDGLADTIKPRLENAKADCKRILVIDESKELLHMQDERIKKAIEKTNAKLLILDPIQAYLGGKVDINRANEARAMTRPLAEIAEQTGCAVILIGHMNKAAGSKAAYRGLGSIDFHAVARSVLLVAKSPTDSSVRVVAQTKNNLAPCGDTVAFSLSENVFTWLGECDISIDELLSGFSAESKQQQAENFLKKILEDNKTIAATEIFSKGKSLNISKRTLENVKQELGIKSIRVGSCWHWSF